MTIKLNDKEYAVAENTSLAAFVESMDLPPRGVAIAAGNEVIPRTEWENTVLHDGMELMLIHAVSGG